MKFDSGEVVRLKCGGPWMVVRAASEVSEVYGTQRVWVSWFTVDQKLQEHEFNSEILEHK